MVKWSQHVIEQAMVFVLSVDACYFFLQLTSFNQQIIHGTPIAYNVRRHLLGPVEILFTDFYMV